jgi:hypothetical protein
MAGRDDAFLYERALRASIVRKEGHRDVITAASGGEYRSSSGVFR